MSALSRRLVRQMEGRIEIENASRVWRECARPAGHEDSSAAWPARMQSSSQAGSHHRTQPQMQDSGTPERRGDGTAGGCEIRGNPEIHRRRRRREDSGKPGDSPLAQPEDARFGATRSSIAGIAGRCEIRGNSKIHQPAPKERGFGATRRLTVGTAGRCRNRGRPEDSSPGGTGGAKIRGNPEIHRQSRRRMRDSRKLEDPSPAQPEDAGSEETRSRAAG